MKQARGFTFIEIVIVTAIITFLAFLVAVNYPKLKARSKLSRISSELASIATSTTQFALDNNNQFPPDVIRAVPPGLEKYLIGGVWPKSIWPEGVFDWDNWTTVDEQPSPQILQVTYRLCDLDDDISFCRDPILFPHFTRYSSIFYCISGPCVPHQAYPLDPGYCVNCKPKEVNPPL